MQCLKSHNDGNVVDMDVWAYVVILYVAKESHDDDKDCSET